MGARRIGGMVLAVGVVLAFGGCSGNRPATVLPGAPVTPGGSVPGDSVPGGSAAGSAPAAETPAPRAEEVRYQVGVRLLRLQRGRHRPLPTLVFYPAGLPTAANRLVEKAGTAPRRAQAVQVAPPRLAEVARISGGVVGLRPAAGRFPLVLFSHGMSGSPRVYSAALAAWASAGFVVAAPSYPYTMEFARDYRREDIVHQPDDARFVLDRVLRLGITEGDPLRWRIDRANIAAVGHSAGGYTTTGLFVDGHDPRLRAGIVMAGWRAPGAFGGAAAEMLFLQGTADPVVPMAKSRAAYEKVPWPKRYLVMRGVSHSNYLRPGDRGWPVMMPAVLDFLRRTLRGGTSPRGLDAAG